MGEVITVENDGPGILSTNYWSLAMEAAGKIFVSVNAGAVRVLLPRAYRELVAEMIPAKHCVLSRGPWPAARLKEAVESMWDDGSKNPFCFHLSPESFDMLPAEPPEGRQWTCSVWVLHRGRPRKVAEHMCYWRRVESIPYLKPWPTGGRTRQ
jgi:hypothetical protein